jgi:hypothetical protein
MSIDDANAKAISFTKALPRGILLRDCYGVILVRQAVSQRCICYQPGQSGRNIGMN